MNNPRFTIYSALWAGFHPLSAFYPEAKQVVADDPAELTGPGILIIHGGQDISPSLYNKKVSKLTYAGEKPSRRDQQEWALMQAAKEKGIPIFGICRGAQLMCAMAGGYLVQDVEGHGGNNHQVETNDGVIMNVNSIHHQMQVPFEVDHTLLAWSKKPLSKHYIGEDEPIAMPCEPEAVFYPGLGLAIQWHPEGMAAESQANQKVKEWCDAYF